LQSPSFDFLSPGLVCLANRRLLLEGVHRPIAYRQLTLVAKTRQPYYNSSRPGFPVYACYDILRFNSSIPSLSRTTT
jgi:hypothetical protein